MTQEELDEFEAKAKAADVIMNLIAELREAKRQWGNYERAGEDMLAKLEALQAERDKLRSELAAKEQACDGWVRIASREQHERGRASAAFAQAYTTLQAENERLREALKPFVREADAWDDEEDDSTDLSGHLFGEMSLTVGDCRNARAALQPQAGEGDGHG